MKLLPEIPKHKKSKQSNISKSSEKSNHKHIYYDVLVKWMSSKTFLTYAKGQKCKKCGRVLGDLMPDFISIPNCSASRMLSDEEMFAKYKDLEIVEQIW